MFEQAIGPSSMINGCTRILVTHSLAYLNQCDWIVVLDGGQVKSQGTFTELLKDEQTAKMIARLDNEATAAAAAAEEETTAAVVGAAGGVVERNSSSNNGGHLASGEESGDDDDDDADEVISDVASMLSSTFTSSPHHLRRRRHTRTSSKVRDGAKLPPDHSGNQFQIDRFVSSFGRCRLGTGVFWGRRRSGAAEQLF
uniref:ABC transporter domain-containing protein n=1 Tax=Globodera pallida TaxID=36090 RepID=A0A183CDR2_GLOPA